MRRTSPRTEQEEQDYQRERNLLVDVLLDELKDLQLSQVRIINDIYHIRSDADRTPDPGPTVAGTSPQDTKDDHLRIGDTVKLKTHGKFRATTGKIVKVTAKRVIVELPNGQTTNRAPHNLRKL